MRGHLAICSSQVGDPEDCMVCKTWPPWLPFRDTVMPPYRYQTPTHGGGWASSNGKSGSYTLATPTREEPR
jgi:hypothetical protein